MSEVRLSVIVTIVEGEGALRACLEALQGQTEPPALEVIVPYDASLPWAPGLIAEFPGCRPVELGRVETSSPISTPAGQHELFDRRRSAGLKEAGGQLVAILEDRGVPDPDWAAAMHHLHSLPHAAIGGAVECGVDRTLNWATYFCDFGRYQLPLRAGPRDYVTDVNIAYKRAALEDVRETWEHRYHETTVHWALTRGGHSLFLSPEPVVRQMRQDLNWRRLLEERVAWGRLFAYTRVRECGLAKRVALAMLAPLLPIVLFVRHLRLQLVKRSRVGEFVRAAPLIAVLLTVWSVGEVVGYVTARP